MASFPRDLKPIGYKWIEESFAVDPIPHYVESFIARPGVRIREEADGRCREIYPHTSFKLSSIFDHLEFALKREGLHLELLRTILPKIPADEMTAFVQAKPTGANVRRLWYLYERFTGDSLAIPDMTTGNYVDLLDPAVYFTGPVRKFPRWRINRNLLRHAHFSPMLRKTAALFPARDAELHERCADLIGEIRPEVFQRALRYLYAKETRTSYAIEHETPSQRRTDHFMRLLARAGSTEFSTKSGLIGLQNAIVDPRFAAKDWRRLQNYVGRTLAPGMEEIHLVPPQPEDLDELMKEWISLAGSFSSRSFPLPPIAAAAICSWLFVYFHPFEDGNGRIHRFLIHHLLKRRGFGPNEVLLPVSAVLLNRPMDYEASLETFSVPLKERSEYELDENGMMTVISPTKDYFRYIDCTRIAEALYRFIEETIEKEIPAELRFLQHYDTARAAMKEVVDLPEPTANLFIKLTLQNQGSLSKKKRELPQFAMLTDGEVADLEAAVAAAYRLTDSGTEDHSRASDTEI